MRPPFISANFKKNELPRKLANSCWDWNWETHSSSIKLIKLHTFPPQFLFTELSSFFLGPIYFYQHTN